MFSGVFMKLLTSITVVRHLESVSRKITRLVW